MAHLQPGGVIPDIPVSKLVVYAQWALHDGDPSAAYSLVLDALHQDPDCEAAQTIKDAIGRKGAAKAHTMDDLARALKARPPEEGGEQGSDKAAGDLRFIHTGPQG